MKRRLFGSARRRLVVELGLLIAGAAVLLGSNTAGLLTSSPVGAAVPAPTAAAHGLLQAPAASSAPIGAAAGAMPINVELPANADCAGCHTTKGGIGTKPIPRVGHPLEGWTNCVACHATDRLVQTAPGHFGIQGDQCLNCHTTFTPAAPMRGHEMVDSTGCLKCHGVTAPLPADMTHRTELTCWVCHRLPEPTESPSAKPQ